MDYVFEAIDKSIDQIGAEYIYGMHLLEEDGHFAVDIDEPGNWWQNKGEVRSGKEDGNPYTNFNNLRKLYGGNSDWCEDVPNVAQYYREFNKETGLNMHYLPDDPLAYPILDRWMARRLWAGAHWEFFKHLKGKYPTIKHFIWGNIAATWNGTDIGYLKDEIDGVITNPYVDTLAIHHSLSGLKAMLPDAEHLILLMGSSDLAMKHIRTATAYLNGASGIGFFESATGDQELWDASVKIWKSLSRLPVLKKAESKVLIVTGNTDNGSSTSKKMLPFFRTPTVLTMRDATRVDLNNYKVVVLHYCESFQNDVALSKYKMTGYGPDDQSLKAWVMAGGILVITAPKFLEDNQFFVSKDGIAWVTNRRPSSLNQPATFSCTPGIAAKYNIRSYYTLLATTRELIWGGTTNYDQLPIGGATVYGKGRIVIIPAYHKDTILLDENTPEEYRNKYLSEMSNYIADVIRGVAIIHDPDGHLKDEITTPRELYGLSWKDDDIDISVKTVFDIPGQQFSSEIIKDGEKILGSSPSDRNSQRE